VVKSISVRSQMEERNMLLNNEGKTFLVIKWHRA
jgi:hypothetical protein